MLGCIRSRLSSRVRLQVVLAAVSCLTLCLAGWLTSLAAGPKAGWSEPASLPTGLAQESAVTLPDGRIVVTGGVTSVDKASTKIQLFDPTTNKWSESAAHLNTGRVLHASAVGHDGKVYVFGGRNAIGPPISEVESYDPASDTVNALSGAGCIVRAGLAATTLSDGRIMLIGGTDISKAVNTVEFFDTATGKCALASGADVMPTARM
ncbi:MAG TPA: kelch repeat-containing protein, partial [Thermomicrobiaceae bacterium]|nr:kelch repeat-containing protein [Thermomicrobiaceae bacterium]